MNIRNELYTIGVGLWELAKISTLIAATISVLYTVYYFFDTIGLVLFFVTIFTCLIAYQIGEMRIITKRWENEK
jgi:hypothetical protein